MSATSPSASTNDELRVDEERFLVRATARFCARFGYQVDESLPKLPPKGVLSFAGQIFDAGYLGHGFGSPENGGIWTVENRASLFLPFATPVAEAVELTLSFVPSTNDGARPKGLQGRILMDGQVVGDLTFGPLPLELTTCTVRIEASGLQSPDGVELAFDFDRVTSPSEAGTGSDVRRLGIFLVSLAYDAR